MGQSASHTALVKELTNIITHIVEGDKEYQDGLGRTAMAELGNGKSKKSVIEQVAHTIQKDIMDDARFGSVFKPQLAKAAAASKLSQGEVSDCVSSACSGVVSTLISRLGNVHSEQAVQQQVVEAYHDMDFDFGRT